MSGSDNSQLHPVLRDRNEYSQLLEGRIDFKRLFFRMLIYWPWFLVSIVAFGISAYFVNKYSDKVYTGAIVVNISTDSKSGPGGGMEAIMTQIGYYNPRLTFENEVIELKSYSLIEIL